MPRVSLCLCLCLCLLTAAAVPARAAAPSLRELGVEPETLPPILGRSQMLLLHTPRDIAWTRDGETHQKKAGFVSSMRVFAAPITAVRAVVSDFAKYPEVIKEVKYVKVETKNGERLVSYETSINLMVMHMSIDYTLAYQDEPNGDLTWHLVDGDYDENLGRWEFFPLAGGKTLAVYTAWQDFESVGITMRTIMRAQPDLRLVIPVASAAVIMASMAKRVEGGDAKPGVLADEPTTPMLSTGDSPVSLPTLRKLAGAGTLMFVHPRQWIKGKNGKPADVLFLSAASLSSLPAGKAKALALSYKRYGEFIDQIGRADVQESPGKKLIDWHLKVGASIFSFPVDYKLEYTEHPPMAWTFKLVGGDLDYCYGAWEFFDVGDGESLILYTTASALGKSAPALLKVGKDMPNRDLIVGVSSTVVTIQKLVPWMEKQR